MAKLLEMPKLSPTMEEGVLSAWHKNEGDTVEVDDLLAEVETDKATMEFRAFDKGILLKILVAPGTNVKLGDSVAILGNTGDDVERAAGEGGSGDRRRGGDARGRVGCGGGEDGGGEHGDEPGGGGARGEADRADDGSAHADDSARSPHIEERAATPRGSILTRTERAPYSVSGGGGLAPVTSAQGERERARARLPLRAQDGARPRARPRRGAHGSGSLAVGCCRPISRSSPTRRSAWRRRRPRRRVPWLARPALRPRRSHR